MICVFDVSGQQLCNNLLQPIVYVFGEYLRDAVYRANDWSRFDVLLVYLIDTVYLWYTSLIESVGLHGALEVDLFGLGRQHVLHGAVEHFEFAALDSQFLSGAFVREEFIVVII